MIGIAVMGILLVLAIPSFQAWIQNTKIRTTTESVLNGMQLARAEAVRRNTQVFFQLQSAPLNSTSGPSDWQIGCVIPQVSTPPAPDDCPPAPPGIQSRSSAEGSDTTTVTITPTNTNTITFNGLGRPVTNSDATLPITQVDVTTTVALPAASLRPLRVTVSSNGSTRMCDPQLPPAISVPPAPSDPRGC